MRISKFKKPISSCNPASTGNAASITVPEVAGIPLAAYDQAIEASHLFNLLQARGVISVQERASYISRVRDLAKGSCEAWIARNAERWAAEFAGWTA